MDIMQEQNEAVDEWENERQSPDGDHNDFAYAVTHEVPQVVAEIPLSTGAEEKWNGLHDPDARLHAGLVTEEIVAADKLRHCVKEVDAHSHGCTIWSIVAYKIAQDGKRRIDCLRYYAAPCMPQHYCQPNHYLKFLSYSSGYDGVKRLAPVAQDDLEVAVALGGGIVAGCVGVIECAYRFSGRSRKFLHLVGLLSLTCTVAAMIEAWCLRSDPFPPRENAITVNIKTTWPHEEWLLWFLKVSHSEILKTVEYVPDVEAMLETSYRDHFNRSANFLLNWNDKLAPKVDDQNKIILAIQPGSINAHARESEAKLSAAECMRYAKRYERPFYPGAPTAANL
jgi:hypothetical protein